MTKAQDKAMDFLSEAMYISQQIIDKKIELDKNFAQKLRVPNSLSGVGGGGNKTKSPVEESVIMYFEKDKRLTNSIKKLERELHKYIKVINKIKDYTIYKIIYKRYIQNEKWDAICKEMGYAKSTVSGYHIKGLDLIYDFIKM